MTLAGLVSIVTLISNVVRNMLCTVHFQSVCPKDLLNSCVKGIIDSLISILWYFQLSLILIEDIVASI